MGIQYVFGDSKLVLHRQTDPGGIVTGQKEIM